MRCEDIQGDLSAYLDGALPMEERAAIEAHLVSCPKCTTQLDDYRRIGRVLREEMAERAPAGLQERIRTEIAREADEESGAARWSRRSVAQAAALLLVAGLSGAGGWFAATTASRAPALAHDVMAAHVRSLLQENLTQVASSDRHTVKPWFGGRLDFSPVVQDLSAQGFPLKGGRLDYVGDRRVAAIIYMRRQHVISLFAWPSDQSVRQPSASTSVKGYNSIRWTRDGMVYWAISDLNMKELGEFQSLLGAA
jgi:mycothiol system anti-sigma-R factor